MLWVEELLAAQSRFAQCGRKCRACRTRHTYCHRKHNQIPFHKRSHLKNRLGETREIQGPFHLDRRLKY